MPATVRVIGRGNRVRRPMREICAVRTKSTYEFALSGYNGKYATRLLGNAGSPDPVPPTKSTYRIYGEAVKESFPDHDGKAPPTESSQSLALGLLSKTPSADTGHVGINVEFQ